MNSISRILRALRKLNDLEVQPLAPWAAALSPGERKICAAQAREGIPTAILGHHDRMAARGKRSLAEVKDGVCGACHLRLPSGHRGHQREFEDMDVCDNCGVFLEWATPEAASCEPPARPDAPAAGAPAAAARAVRPAPARTPRAARRTRAVTGTDARARSAR